MKIQRPKYSQDIDADVAVGVIGRNLASAAGADIPVETAFEFNGVHERTAKGDSLNISVSSTAKRNAVSYLLKRDSLYHILPEYLFHPLDRYADTDGDKEAFHDHRATQQKVEAEAKEYFYPFDKTLNELRIRWQDHLNDEILDREAFIVDFITEQGNVNKANPFIKACLPNIIHLRANRGSWSLVATALNMAFGNGLATLDKHHAECPVDIDPESCHICLDGTIDDLFCGNSFMDWVEIIYVRYQTEIASSEAIDTITGAIEEFRTFFSQWFLNDRQKLVIEFGDYIKPPVLSDSAADGSLYLNYNTQLSVS